MRDRGTMNLSESALYKHSNMVFSYISWVSGAVSLFLMFLLSAYPETIYSLDYPTIKGLYLMVATGGLVSVCFDIAATLRTIDLGKFRLLWCLGIISALKAGFFLVCGQNVLFMDETGRLYIGTPSHTLPVFIVLVGISTMILITAAYRNVRTN